MSELTDYLRKFAVFRRDSLPLIANYYDFVMLNNVGEADTPATDYPTLILFKSHRVAVESSLIKAKLFLSWTSVTAATVGAVIAAFQSTAPPTIALSQGTTADSNRYILTLLVDTSVATMNHGTQVQSVNFNEFAGLKIDANTVFGLYLCGNGGVVGATAQLVFSKGPASIVRS